MSDKYTKEFYLETYQKIIIKDKKLLLSKSEVSKNYIYDTKQLFKNALDSYFSNKRVYDSTKLPKEYRKNGKLKTRMGNDRFYKFLSIIVDYTNNNPKQIDKIANLENQFMGGEFLTDFFNNNLDSIWTDHNILYHQDKIIYLYKRLSVLQENCNTIDGIPTKDSSDEETSNISMNTMEIVSDSSEEEEEEGEEEDHILEEAMIEDQQLLALKHLSKKINIDFEELIKKEMPDFYKRENEKGRISKTLEYFESI